jgi:hypothetical protein
MGDSIQTLPDFDSSFERALNSHGYPFQYLVLSEGARLFETGTSPWLFLAAEFPVEVGGAGTRVDLILRHRSEPHFLLVECKRADPALSHWCFARAPVVHRSRTDEFFFAEHLFVADAPARIIPQRHGPVESAYHVALALRSGEKGDGRAGGRGAIEEACTQVLRGLNGFIRFLAHHSPVLGKASEAIVFPAIITTANLHASDVDLRQGDLAAGTIAKGSASLKSEEWLLYQYNQGPSLKHDVQLGKAMPSNLGKILDLEFVRTIPIVSASGIASFLSWAGAIEASDFVDAG